MSEILIPVLVIAYRRNREYSKNKTPVRVV